jgi:hypothetical protein
MADRELLIDALQQVTDALEAETAEGRSAALANARESLGALVGDDEATE